MTLDVSPPPDLEAALEPPRPVPAARRGGRAPWYLWAVAGLVLVPVLVPFANLVGRVAGGGAESLDTFISNRTAELLVNTVVLTLAVTTAAAAMGVGAAWAVARGRLRGQRIWMVLLTVPLVVPSYVLALVILSTFGPSGLIADAIGRDIPAMAGFWGAWLALTLSTYPFVFLVALASLRRLDPALEEAARGLGASQGRVFRTIVLPQLRPAVAAGSLLVALYTLSDFGAVSLMRFDAFTRVIYAQYAGRLDRTPAAVLALVLVVLALIVLAVEQWTRGRAAYYTTKPAQRSMGAGKRQPLLLALVFLLVLAAIIGPLLVLGIWLGRGLSRGQDLYLPWGAVAGSLTAASLAAVLAVLAGLPVGVLVTRFRSRAAGWVERIVYAVHALPHITVALAVVFFASNFLGGLYQSLTLLVVVYGAIFLAQALGSTRAGLLSVNPHLEEASRGLGKGPMRTVVNVTVPLIRRSLLAGGLLVFLTAMKELPAMLLLRPTGFDALSVEIWAAADELLYARAASAALLLVFASAIPMYLLATRANDP